MGDIIRLSHRINLLNAGSFIGMMIAVKANVRTANAIVGLDMETSDLGLQADVIVVSATGTAVIVEPE